MGSARVDVVRSSRRLRIELDGVVLAETSSPVMLFETGLPPRHYIDRTAIDFGHLVPSEKVTSCLDEKVDTYVDGQPLERPRTPFS